LSIGIHHEGVIIVDAPVQVPLIDKQLGVVLVSVDTPALSLADEIPIFAVSNSSPAPSCTRPRSPAFPHSVRSLVRIPALHHIPALRRFPVL